MAAHLVVQLMLGPGVSTAEELIEHVHRLVDGIAVALPEEAGQGREAAGPGNLAEAVRRAFADVVEQGALIIGVRPEKIDGQDAGGLDGGQLVGEIQMLRGKRVSKASIAKILDVAPSTLDSFIQSRRLEPKKRRQA
jgi:hypothetical protein